MSKKKTFRFSTSITPISEISLSGFSGQPLEMTLKSNGPAKTIKMDLESVLKLQTFLSDYLNPEERPSQAVEYRPTGRALAVMDADTLDIKHVFLAQQAIGIAEVEEEEYNELAQKVAVLTDTTLPEKPLFVFFDTFDGTIGRAVIHRIIRAFVTYQVKYVRTGNVFFCRPMINKDIEAFTGIDESVISRATRNVRIVSRAGTFSLNSSDSSLKTPSLIDEGTKRTDNTKCSRKEVLSVLVQIIKDEDPTKPKADEDLSEELRRKGYIVARRTVSKYRGILGIPKQCKRRIKEKRSLN